MAKSLNTWAGSGYLAADPKTHTFDDGAMVATLRLAVNNQKKVDGQWIDDVLFVDVKTYGPIAEACGKYLHKGAFIVARGQLAKPRHWQDANTGETRVTLVIERAEVVFGPRTDGGSGQAQQAAPSAPAGSAVVADDDIPF